MLLAGCVRSRVTGLTPSLATIQYGTVGMRASFGARGTGDGVSVQPLEVEGAPWIRVSEAW